MGGYDKVGETCVAKGETPTIMFANGPEIRSYTRKDRKYADVYRGAFRIEAIDFDPKRNVVYWSDSYEKAIKRSLIPQRGNEARVGFAQDLKFKGKVVSSIFLKLQGLDIDTVNKNSNANGFRLRIQSKSMYCTSCSIRGFKHMINFKIPGSSNPRGTATGDSEPSTDSFLDFQQGRCTLSWFSKLLHCLSCIQHLKREILGNHRFVYMCSGSGLIPFAKFSTHSLYISRNVLPFTALFLMLAFCFYVNITGTAKPAGIAFDWVGDNLYWTEIDRSSNTHRGRIVVAKSDGRYRRSVVYTGLEAPTAIAVDPELG